MAREKKGTKGVKKIKILFTTDLRDKLLFTLLMIMMFRVLSHIPVPFVNLDALSVMGDDLFGMINLFSGGALKNFTIMATGISAYISASIVIQLLSYFVPAVHMMVRSPGGDKKVKKITIGLGIFNAIFSSMITTFAMHQTYHMLTNTSWYVFLTIAFLHACGTGIAIWIGETITEKGFGNGMSLLVCINVLSSVPSMISMMNGIDVIIIAIVVCMAVLTIMLTILAETSERRIPLFYPKAAARGKFLKDAMYFPIKLNVSGVMPIILAGYIVQFLSMLGKLDNGFGRFMAMITNSQSYVYIIGFTILVYLFTFVYALVSFDAREVSENIQKNGAIIPGIRPGKDTTNYVKRVRKYITKMSAAYLTFVYFFPTVILTAVGANFIQASSIIILVGVSLETCKALKVEIELRDYKTL